jgi:effector-binding domain-containing protein
LLKKDKMEAKIIKPMTVLYYSEKNNLTGLARLVRTKAKELYIEAIRYGMEVTGPVYWIYYGMDGNPDTTFTLEIAIPVYNEKIYSGDYEIKRLSAYKCAAAVHNGPWKNMQGAYAKLVEETLKKGHTLNGISREVYINIDFVESANNITEIQLGIN